jgi:type I restriction enzyme M protein
VGNDFPAALDPCGEITKSDIEDPRAKPVTYQHRKEETRYSRRVDMPEVEKNDFNLNISRYISTALGETEIDLAGTHQQLVEIGKEIAKAAKTNNAFLKELGLPRLPE